MVAIHGLTITMPDPGGLALSPSIALRQLINFPVFAFLALSGFFIRRAVFRGAGRSTAKTLKRVMIPYVIAFLITSALFHHGLLSSPQGLVMMLFAGKGISIGYYVVVFLQFLILTPILLRLRSAKAHLVAMVIGVVLGAVFTYSSVFVWSGHRLSAFPFRALPFFVWCPSFHLGLWLGLRPDIVARLKRGPVLIGLGAALILSFLEAAVLAGHGIGLASSQTKLTSILVSVMVVLLVMAPRTGSARPMTSTNLLIPLGQSSFFIYLYHLNFMRLAEKASHYLPTAAALRIPFVIVLTLVLTYLAAIVVRQLLGRRAAGRFFGV
ncbi:hypothetical protein DL237_07745 [Pseudooceanicola sediminis]|uniref:Acyltransferase 3 domain-containing protein n=1 Tax=Pseudooceanicola sediminis TaxID=2211117 RepID=A0A399J561_9RHOB|nr:acyltransferase family protein [Pseudooceanicola sediminis]RII39519.1 hypothetical protein DL237_07745 [Pseudooceanicola sediminis]